jgi:hypothetical protein
LELILTTVDEDTRTVIGDYLSADLLFDTDYYIGLQNGIGSNFYITTSHNKWVVVECEDFSIYKFHVKFSNGKIVFCGNQLAATQFLYNKRPGPIVGLCMEAGDYCSFSGGDKSILIGGNYCILSGGIYSKLTGKNNSNITGGYGSTITAGHNSTLMGGPQANIIGGDYSTLIGGTGSDLIGGKYATLIGNQNCIFKADIGSTFTSLWFDKDHKQQTTIVNVDDDLIKINSSYEFKDGNIYKI